MLPLCPMNLFGRTFGDKLKTNIFPSSLPVIDCFLYEIMLYNFFNYIFGLKIQEFIALVFPLYVRLRTGSENIVWGKIVFDILGVAFIFDMI